MLGRVHPVELYSAAVSLILCAGLWHRLPQRSFAGQVAALALLIGGAGSFLLDMLRQPIESFGNAWLDPGQIVALAALLIGAYLFTWQRWSLVSRTSGMVSTASRDHDEQVHPTSENSGHPVVEEVV